MTTSAVSSGQTLPNSTISGGTTIDVLSGGTLSSASVLIGGAVIIEAGGVDLGSVISAGGTELVYGSATGDIVAGSQTVSSSTAAGVITGETVVSGGVVTLAIKTTSAADTTIDAGGTVNLNGNISAFNTVLSGGTIDLQSAKAALTGSLVFAGGGTLEVTGNTSAGSGDLAVISGFAAGDVIDMTSATTLGAATSDTLTLTTSSGNTVATVSGGGVSDAYIFAGTAIAANLAVFSDGAGGEELTFSGSGAVTSVGSGTSQTNLTVSAGSPLTVYNGGTLIDGLVQSGGLVTVSSGGLDQGSVISAGGSETLLGSASADSVFGTQTLGGGTAIASGETVQAGGTVALAVSGASASGVTVLSGGSLDVTDGASAVDIVIEGGSVTLETAQASVSGVLAFDGAGTLDIATLSSAGAGDQAVISGFYYGDAITLAAIGAGATLSTTVSGGNTVATVTSGGASGSVTFSGSVASSLSLTTSGGVSQIAFAPPPTTTSYTPGDLVLSVYGDGSGTGVVQLDQAAPITLEEITTTGQVVSTQELTQTTAVVNGVTEYAISGEYESASEGLLTLAEDGQSLTILGYGVTATAFDAANAASVYGTTALGQTSSLLGGQYTAVDRVVADIGYDGSVDTSTSLSGVFNTNNPRSVITVNGTTFYLSGQGNGTDGTEGVFLASDGSSSATPIYNTTTDTREVAIYDGQLYVSVDSKSNDGGGVYDFGATLPTSATAPTVLPGIGSSITLAAGQANTANASAVGTSINLSPEQYFFANATTLYVADGGDPKEGGLGDGGLQKWSLVGGTWVLDYTLSAGLNLVPDTEADGTTGLVGLTGTVEGGNVILYASNETVAETDQTYLYGITDQLAATTLPTSESFTLLETAAPGTLIRGVAFAPSASTTGDVTSTQTIAATVSSGGLTIANGGSLVVLSGGTITATTLLSGGSATISAGGVDSGTFVATGAGEIVLGAASADTVGGTETVADPAAVVSGDIIENGGTLALTTSGATASGATVMNGGTLLVGALAVATDTVISGGTVILQSSQSVLSGGVDFVGSGGTLDIVSASFSDYAIISGFGAGDVVDESAIGNGATLNATVFGPDVFVSISSGGTTENLRFATSGGVAAANYLSGLSLISDGAGGEDIIYTPPAPIVVSSGVTSGPLTVTVGNSITVLSGGTMSAIDLTSGASATISAGGFDVGSTIEAGGYETVDGDANGDQIYGVQYVTTGGSAGALPATVENETVFNGGSLELYLKPDVATNITVSSGGFLLLNGNVSATNTTLDTGATMELQSPKAVFNGTLTFNGAATLAVTDTTSAGYGSIGTIDGFAAGDVIDETLISSAVATLTTTTSGGNTVETISGAAFPDSFTFAGTAIAADIVLVSDGASGSELVYEAACMAAGTDIMTPSGPRAIETLRAGDMLLTASGAARPAKWLGYRSVDLHRHPRPHDVQPIRVQAHAVAPGCPSRDLLLSPDHAVFLEGALIPVRYLLNGASIVQEDRAAITWWHVELDTHDLIMAEGVATESYLDTGNRAAFANAGPGHAMQMHPDFSRGVWAAQSRAPLLTEGPALARARAALLARLAELGHAITADPELRLEAAGIPLEPQLFDAWTVVVMPDAATDLRLRSRRFQPAALQTSGTDWRSLGVGLAGLRIDGEDVALDAPAFAEGWHPAEDGLRWSNGEAILRVPPASVIELRMAPGGRYIGAAAAEVRREAAAA